MHLPAAAEQIITLLESAGFSCYAVGGCVRDALLGQQPEDWDLCTAALPGEVKSLLQAAGLRVIDTGLQHGTVTALTDGTAMEITTFRRDGAYTDHRRPDSVAFTADLRADLSRRDFTINAMAWHPRRGLSDPFGGRADLENGILRCVGEAPRRFDEDALRILRCLRFAATLGFRIDPATARAMHAARATLGLVAAERVQKELTRLLCGKAARQVLTEHRQVIFEVLPQLRPLSGFDQRTPWHCYDIWEHSCAAVEAVPPSPALRWAALLHDAGKPQCFFMRDGCGHFHGHPAVSETIAREIFTQLKCPKRFSQQVFTLIRRHELRLLEEPPNPKRLRRLLGELGEDLLLALIELMRADVAAQAPEKLHRLQGYEPLRAAVQALAREGVCTTRKQLAVTGGDLLPLGLRGPQLGRMLALLLEGVLDGQLPNERAALLAWAEENKQPLLGEKGL